MFRSTPSTVIRGFLCRTLCCYYIGFRWFAYVDCAVCGCMCLPSVCVCDWCCCQGDIFLVFWMVKWVDVFKVYKFMSWNK